MRDNIDIIVIHLDRSLLVRLAALFQTLLVSILIGRNRTLVIIARDLPIANNFLTPVFELIT